METLRDLRKQSKKTLAEVADVLGVSVQAVCNYEKGRRLINVFQVLTLANLYDVSAEEVINAQKEVFTCLKDLTSSQPIR